MDLKLVFRISAVIKVINGLGLLFMGATFFTMANLTPTPDLITVGQFLGVTVLFLAIVEWRIPDIGGDSISSLSQLWAIGNVLWFLIAGYHIMSGQAGGSTGYINVALFAVFAVLFYMKSRKSE
mgnify:CR=1 FL=1